MPVIRGSTNKAPVTAGEVFSLIRDGVATTRTELRRLTGLSRTAVAARVSALSDRGLVVEREEGLSTGGRPPTLLMLRFRRGRGAVSRDRTQPDATCRRNLAGDIRPSAISTRKSGSGQMT